MKKILLALALGFLLQPGKLQATENGSREVLVPVQEAFIPDFQSSNSDAFVVVSGYFQNGCFSWSRGEVTANGESLEVRVYALVRPGLCPMYLVPYTKDIHMGRLPRGTYSIRFVSPHDTYIERQLVIN